MTRYADDGFALVAVLIALLVLTALAAGALAAALLDGRIAEEHRAGVEALYVAESGLQTVLGKDTLSPPADASYAFPSGVAHVSARRLLRLGGGRDLIVLTSVGQSLRLPRAPARRTVQLIATRTAGPPSVPAAVAAQGGIRVRGTVGGISGFDAASPNSCAASASPDTAGVAVPSGGFVALGGGGPTGRPPVLSVPPPASAVTVPGLPWPATLARLAAVADLVIPPGAPADIGRLPAGSWPVVLLADSSSTLSLPVPAGGVLIASGNLRLDAPFVWRGLLLTGRRLTTHGPVSVYGATLVGVATAPGDSAGMADISGFGARFRFDSCALAAAARRLTGYAPRVGSWREII